MSKKSKKLEKAIKKASKKALGKLEKKIEREAKAAVKRAVRQELGALFTVASIPEVAVTESEKRDEKSSAAIAQMVSEGGPVGSVNAVVDHMKEDTGSIKWWTPAIGHVAYPGGEFAQNHKAIVPLLSAEQVAELRTVYPAHNPDDAHGVLPAGHVVPGAGKYSREELDKFYFDDREEDNGSDLNFLKRQMVAIGVTIIFVIILGIANNFTP